MSLVEIIEELPELTHHQMRELCQRIIALVAEREDLAICDQSALESFALLDQM